MSWRVWARASAFSAAHSHPTTRAIMLLGCRGLLGRPGRAWARLGNLNPCSWAFLDRPPDVISYDRRTVNLETARLTPGQGARGCNACQRAPIAMAETALVGEIPHGDRFRVEKVAAPLR